MRAVRTTLTTGQALPDTFTNKTMFVADSGNSATIPLIDADGTVIARLDSGDSITDPVQGVLSALYRNPVIGAGDSLHISAYQS